MDHRDCKPNCNSKKNCCGVVDGKDHAALMARRPSFRFDPDQSDSRKLREPFAAAWKAAVAAPGIDSRMSLTSRIEQSRKSPICSDRPDVS